MKSDADKERLSHKLKGTIVLGDAVMEKVAYFLSHPVTAADVDQLGVTAKMVDDKKREEARQGRVVRLHEMHVLGRCAVGTRLVIRINGKRISDCGVQQGQRR